MPDDKERIREALIARQRREAETADRQKTAADARKQELDAQRAAGERFLGTLTTFFREINAQDKGYQVAPAPGSVELVADSGTNVERRWVVSVAGSAATCAYSSRRSKAGASEPVLPKEAPLDDRSIEAIKSHVLPRL
jgi:hypothetical protein